MRLCLHCFERVLCDIMEKIKRLVPRKDNTIPTEVICDEGSILTDITDVFEHWLNCTTEVKVAILIMRSNYSL